MAYDSAAVMILNLVLRPLAESLRSQPLLWIIGVTNAITIVIPIVILYKVWLTVTDPH